MSPGSSSHVVGAARSRRRIFSGTSGRSARSACRPIAPAPPALHLQQEHVVRVDVRADAAARRRIADHHVVEPRVRDEREAPQQRVGRIAVQVQRPAPAASSRGAGRRASARAAERPVLERPARCRARCTSRDSTSSRRASANSVVARGDTGESRHRTAHEQRLLVPVARDEIALAVGPPSRWPRSPFAIAPVQRGRRAPGGTMPARALPDRARNACTHEQIHPT